MSTKIYLDFAAASPLDEGVLEAMLPYFSSRFYNPSNIDDEARLVRADLEAARAKVAFWLGARESEVIFTAGATEANNLAIRGVMNQYPDGNCIISAIEHDSVTAPASEFEAKMLSVNEKGRVELGSLKDLIDSKTVLVSVMYANNEIGSIQPLSEIAQLIKQVRLERKKQSNTFPLLLHTDAAQASQYLDLHVDRIGVDLMSINGGKIYGPKQSGVLYIRGGTQLKAQITGGGQEFNIRSGTENVASSIGFAAALGKAQKMRAEESKRVEVLRDQLIEAIAQSFPGAQLNGSKNHRLPNNVSFNFDGMDGERLIMMLDAKSLICNTGSACSAQKDESSHVIKALGCSESQAAGTLRFTLGRSTTQHEINQSMEILKQVFSEYEKL